MARPSTTEVRSGAQSVERALSVLRSLAASPDDLGVSEIAASTGLSVSTAHRLTRALCAGGLLAQDVRSERYQLGPALVALGRIAEERLGYTRALPELRRLAADTGESVNLGILAGGEVVVVLDVASTQPLRFEQTVGSRIPAHTSAMGKCLLAGSGDIERAVAALDHLEQVTPRTVTDRARLRSELDLVAERGWALNDEERNPGVRAVAAPVPPPGSGAAVAVAAIAVQGPARRLDDACLDELAARVVAAAAAIAPLLAPSGP